MFNKRQKNFFQKLQFLFSKVSCLGAVKKVLYSGRESRVGKKVTTSYIGERKCSQKCHSLKNFLFFFSSSAFTSLYLRRLWQYYCKPQKMIIYDSYDPFSTGNLSTLQVIAYKKHVNHVPKCISYLEAIMVMTGRTCCIKAAHIYICIYTYIHIYTYIYIIYIYIYIVYIYYIYILRSYCTCTCSLSSYSVHYVLLKLKFFFHAYYVLCSSGNVGTPWIFECVPRCTSCPNVITKYFSILELHNFEDAFSVVMQV